MVKRLRALLFDFDGTLANTIPLCVHALQQAVERTTGKTYSDEEIIAEFGITEEGILRKLVGEQYELAVNEFLELYEAGHPEISLLDGMEALLKRLRNSGVKLGVVTGKGAGSAGISAEYLGLRSYFDEIRTGSDERDVKAANIVGLLEVFGVAADEAAYVGDAVSDLAGAREAGVTAIAAAWAPTADAAQLEEAGADVVCRTVRELVAWIEGRC